MNYNKPEDQRFGDLFNKYLKESCSNEEARELLKILEDPSNDQLIKSEAFKVWNEYSENPGENDSMSDVLNDLHNRINADIGEKSGTQIFKKRLGRFLLRAAAVLFIPLMFYSGYLTFKYTDKLNNNIGQVMTQTVQVPSGVQTNFILPDGSHIWLNSGSVLKYPNSFRGRLRQVELTGEAYFDIARDPHRPFIVNAGTVNIEVKGTKFDVINYADDPQLEVILESGQVSLYSGHNGENKPIVSMKPGERATYNKSLNTTSINKVDVEKYTLWKDGVLIFRDDPIYEVTKKLSHKFNVDIELQNPDINEYVYTATFINESLIQILELLKISAPLNYKIIDQKKLNDNSYSRLKIIITKK